MVNVQHSHPTLRKYLELTQDVIMLGLCALLFAAMGMKLFHLVRLMINGPISRWLSATSFSCWFSWNSSACC